jgi:3alpha(or 20beta)-hydroxysteroid dehydrogenase
MKGLQGRVAIVTGASRGQGAAISKRFALEGAHVVLTDIRLEEGKETARSLDSTFERLDVASEDDWARVVGGVVETFGRLDILVNNAGIAHLGETTEMSLKDYMHVINVDQVGVFLGMRAVGQVMKQARRGVIANNSSVGGILGIAGFGSYNAAKHAVVGMTKAAAIELAPFGIRVNCVLPGGVNTRMNESIPGSEKIDNKAASTSVAPMGRNAEPDEIASLFNFLVSDESSFITGVAIPIDGGWTAGVSLPTADG